MTTITLDGPLAAGTYTLTPAGYTPPVIPPIQPPVQPPVTGGHRLMQTLPWGVGFSVTLPMVAQDEIAFAFTVPAGAVAGQVCQLNISEYGGLAYSRQMTLHPDPWDYAPHAGWSNGTSVAIACTVGANVLAGGAYYINLRNWSADLGAQSAPDGMPTPIIANWQPR